MAVTFCTTGNDPDLDRLLFAFHYLTGARQEGAWRLQLQHLDDDQQAIAIPDKRSRAKRGSPADDDWMPVPAWLLDELRAFAASRGSSRPDDPVFRYRSRRRTGEPHPPLTRRRYNTIYDASPNSTPGRQRRGSASTRCATTPPPSCKPSAANPSRNGSCATPLRGRPRATAGPRSNTWPGPWPRGRATRTPRLELPPWLRNEDASADGLDDDGRPIA